MCGLPKFEQCDFFKTQEGKLILPHLGFSYITIQLYHYELASW